MLLHLGPFITFRPSTTLLIDTFVSGQLYLRTPSQNLVFFNSHTNYVFLQEQSFCGNRVSKCRHLNSTGKPPKQTNEFSGRTKREAGFLFSGSGSVKTKTEQTEILTTKTKKKNYKVKQTNLVFCPIYIQFEKQTFFGMPGTNDIKDRALCLVYFPD